MRINQIAEIAVEHLLGRIIRRMLIAAVFALCAIAALYQFTAASLLALEAPYGPLDARLIVGVAYAVIGMIALAAFWVNRSGRGVEASSKAVTAPRELQLVMLVEAVMLGYELARKRDPLHRRND